MTLNMYRACLLAIAVYIGGCASSPDPMDVAFGLAPVKQLSPEQLAEMSKHPLGSAENPVRVHMPAGESAYLNRLTCPDGARPKYERSGSVSKLSPFGTIMDVYNVTCGADTSAIYMDMYHPGYTEQTAIPGFTIDAVGST